MREFYNKHGYFYHKVCYDLACKHDLTNKQIIKLNCQGYPRDYHEWESIVGDVV